MEELRSTEILDREIQEDARKKAEEILKNAEVEAQHILEATTSRLERTRKAKELFYHNQIEHIKRDIDAAIPLEEERFLVAFEDGAVSKAMEDYFSKMSEEKKLELLSKLLHYYKDKLSVSSSRHGNISLENSTPFNVKTAGLNKEKLKKIVLEVLGDNSVSSCNELSEIERRDIYNLSHEIFMGNGNLEGMILESEDGNVRLRVTLSVIIEEIMDKYAEELATTLFCGRLPE